MVLAEQLGHGRWTAHANGGPDDCQRSTALRQACVCGDCHGIDTLTAWLALHSAVEHLSGRPGYVAQRSAWIASRTRAGRVASLVLAKSEGAGWRRIQNELS